METAFIFVSAILGLITFSAFFAAAETAITGVSQATIHRLKLEGNHRAKLVSVLRNDKEKVISALLLGNSACNSFASALAATLAIKLFGSESSVLYATVIITVVIFVLAEVLPKAYAFEHPEKISLFLAPILMVLVKILYPIITAVQIIVNFTLNLFGLKANKNTSIISGAEELRGAIELHHHEGSVVKSDRDMLGSILDLGDTEVSEIMIHRREMTTFNIELPTNEIVQKILESPHTRIPVWRNDPDNIVGILNIKDFLKTLKFHEGNWDAIDIKQIITPPWFIPESTLLSEQLHEFRRRRNHFALVIDEYGGLLGLVTLEDILEEIVGQIDDEHDRTSFGITQENEYSYIVEGTITIRDVNRELGWDLPDEEANTIAGLIMHETEIVPEQGESFIIHGLKFTILKKHYNQICSVRAEILKHNDDKEDFL